MGGVGVKLRRLVERLVKTIVGACMMLTEPRCPVLTRALQLAR